MQQLVLLCMFGIASSMTVGSLSVLQFAYNLQSVPLAIIGASYSIAAFPYLADLYAQKRMQDFAFHITTALRHIIFWSLPACALLIVLRAHVVRVVLGSGEFSWADTRLTSAVLALLVLSLVAQAVNLLIVRAFYAGGNTRTPFLVTFIGSVLSISATMYLYHLYSTHMSFGVWLEQLLRVEGVAGAEVLVIALAYSTAMLLQTLILTTLAFRSFSISGITFLPHLGRSLCAACVGALSAYIALNFFAEGINETSFLGILIQGAFGGVMGIIGIVLTYRALHSQELSEIYQSFHSRVFKTDIIASEADIL
jgi:putative peptidoglycan lipid II flippase